MNLLNMVALMLVLVLIPGLAILCSLTRTRRERNRRSTLKRHTAPAKARGMVWTPKHGWGLSPAAVQKEIAARERDLGIGDHPSYSGLDNPGNLLILGKGLSPAFAEVQHDLMLDEAIKEHGLEGRSIKGRFQVVQAPRRCPERALNDIKEQLSTLNDRASALSNEVFDKQKSIAMSAAEMEAYMSEVVAFHAPQVDAIAAVSGRYAFQPSRKEA